MADENGEQDQENSSDGWLWAIIGLVVGGVLAIKVLSAMGAREGNPPSLMELLIALALFLGPFYAMTTAAEHLRDDVKAGKSTNATYWTTMVGISVAALALVGVTSIDDLIGLAK
ncbi:hypothetical protein [Streptomyces stackebrandtii]|uniref:hypothetical protein n=1 Tax=Streptomyces stackebrandtii TaxID=3051177 RepID=UPI0028DC23FF|nr:hypothetical protein [Streptomyces sp. DSM 40976]